ncbi:MAG: ABC transporter permease subunit [Candidatus Cloacimonetes bacterium]|nr:ABC transporter permease subunit [Candidatus Cloacimonadota bacterium]
MNYTKLIANKELKSYFSSPTAYIVLVFFLLISGWFFTSPLFINNIAELASFFNIVPIIFIFFIPAITMSLISKEKNAGTLEILTTFPIKDSEIVIGKFWASLSLIGIGLIFTVVHLLTIVILGTNVDFGAIFCGYLGIIVLGAAYSAIGIFASSITDNQIVAFIISFFIIFFLYIINFSLIFIPDAIVGIFQYLSISYHLSNFFRGVIDTRNVIYFLSITILFLRLATITLESRKWK